LAELSHEVARAAVRNQTLKTRSKAIRTCVTGGPPDRPVAAPDLDSGGVCAIESRRSRRFWRRKTRSHGAEQVPLNSGPCRTDDGGRTHGADARKAMRRRLRGLVQFIDKRQPRPSTRLRRPDRGGEWRTSPPASFAFGHRPCQVPCEGAGVLRQHSTTSHRQAL